MISCEDLAHIKISFANLRGGFTAAHTYNLQWPTGFNLEVVLNARWKNQSQPTHQTRQPRLTTPIDYTYYTEVEEEIIPDERAPPCRQLRSGTLPKWTTSFSAESVEEPVTPAPPESTAIISATR